MQPGYLKVRLNLGWTRFFSASILMVLLSGLLLQGGETLVEPKKQDSFVRLSNKNGVWLFSKKGGCFQSLGINCILPSEENASDADKPYNVLSQFGGDRWKWAESAIDRVRKWGFNSAGAWCAEEIYQQPFPHARMVWFGGYGSETDMRLIDVFTDTYAQAIEQRAIKEVEPYKDDSWLIGYFTNNELPFYGEHGWPTRPERSLFDRYFELPATAPGKKRVVAFFRENYLTGREASRDWEEPASGWDHLEDSSSAPRAKTLDAQRFKYRWAGIVAEQYYKLCENAIRRHDPYHLILGSRFAGKPPRAVAEAQGRHTDVVSINHYQVDGVPDLRMLRNLHAMTKRPILITEYSWRAVENNSGNKNKKGVNVTVSTQAKRAECYAKYTRSVLEEPYILGAHWFQYFDQPANGRSFDGEDSNYGLVDIYDKPYEAMVQATQDINGEASSYFRHARTLVFDEASWGELLPLRVGGGELSQTLAVPLSGPSCNIVQADEKNLSRGTWTVVDGHATLSYQSQGGWGLEGDIALPESFKAGGAKSVELEFTAPPGLKFHAYLTETGDAPPGEQAYHGSHGADGESFELPTIQANGQRQKAMVLLSQANLRQYWGNQRGNFTIDLNGLRCVSIFIPSAQGTGEITIHNLYFAP